MGVVYRISVSLSQPPRIPIGSRANPVTKFCYNPLHPVTPQILVKSPYMSHIKAASENSPHRRRQHPHRRLNRLYCNQPHNQKTNGHHHALQPSPTTTSQRPKAHSSRPLVHTHRHARATPMVVPAASHAHAAPRRIHRRTDSPLPHTRPQKRRPRSTPAARLPTVEGHPRRHRPQQGLDAHLAHLILAMAHARHHHQPQQRHMVGVGIQYRLRMVVRPRHPTPHRPSHRPAPPLHRRQHHRVLEKRPHY